VTSKKIKSNFIASFRYFFKKTGMREHLVSPGSVRLPAICDECSVVWQDENLLWKGADRSQAIGQVSVVARSVRTCVG